MGLGMPINCQYCTYLRVSISEVSCGLNFSLCGFNFSLYQHQHCWLSPHLRISGGSRILGFGSNSALPCRRYIVQRCVAPIRPHEAWKKKIAFIFHFSGWALVAHSCFALLSSTWNCIKLWWRWQLENYKIDTKCHEVRSSASLAS